MPLISILLKWETLDISMSVSVKTNLKGFFFVWLVSQLNLVVKVSLLLEVGGVFVFEDAAFAAGILTDS